MHDLTKVVEAHYGRSGLSEAILAALSNSGMDLYNVSPEELAPLDEFHIRGREATIELAHLLGLSENYHVLDVGSGLGGPSRTLAAEFRCRVTGLDLTEEYCRVARMLSEFTRLADRTEYRHGNALDMPFSNDTFDVTWTQHASMNIADKERFYAEVYRVLKPDGRFAMYDIVAGPGGELNFPVPWARDVSSSFLTQPDKMRAKLEASGFTVIVWNDVTPLVYDWYRTISKTTSGSPRLDRQLLLGSDYAVMLRNQHKNLEENRYGLLQAIVQKK
jgi:ubiquinone/menaquinone biosynthesis C-methylase UbiE